MPSVKDLMTEEVVVASLSETALEAARLMKEKGIGSIIVVDQGKPVGILTERDFLRKVVAEDLPPSKIYVRDVMSKPLITVDPHDSIKHAARLMVENRIRRLAVVENNVLVGIIVAADFAKQLSKRSISEEILDAMARYPSYPI